ncbi:MAG: helix-turn-helix domain-containing protein [Dehalococcoidia bacterium]
MSARWGLLTNHALVLIHVVEHPRSTLRDIAAAVGITERAATSILRALEEDGIITRRKEGRRNVYSVDIEALLRHSSHGTYTIGQLVAALQLISVELPPVTLPPNLLQTVQDRAWTANPEPSAESRAAD